MRTDMTHTGPFYAVRLIFRDESKPDVFGWEAISQRWRQAVSQTDGRSQIHLRSIMNGSNDWQGGLPEPLASIDAGMAGDKGANLREARLFNRVANGIFAERRKAQRVEGAASPAGVVAEQIAPLQFATPEAIVTIAGALKRIADHFDPPPPDVVDSVFVSQKLDCTTQWVAEMARKGEIPVACIVPGTGNGKLWKFYRSKIEKWLEDR